MPRPGRQDRPAPTQAKASHAASDAAIPSQGRRPLMIVDLRLSALLAAQAAPWGSPGGLTAPRPPIAI